VEVVVIDVYHSLSEGQSLCAYFYGSGACALCAGLGANGLETRVSRDLASGRLFAAVVICGCCFHHSLSSSGALLLCLAWSCGLQVDRRGGPGMGKNMARKGGRAGSMAAMKTPPPSLEPCMPWQAILIADTAAAAFLG
jgi:hypothetical protein